MKTTVFALIALSVLISAPFNAKDFFAYLERWGGGND
jgi:hypothetical protein